MHHRKRVVERVRSLGCCDAQQPFQAHVDEHMALIDRYDPDGKTQQTSGGDVRTDAF